MGGCYTCMKYLFIVLNLLFLIFGIAGIVFTVWILVDPTIPLRFTQEHYDFMVSTSIYLVVAIVLVILSIMGIYSVCKEVRWTLVLSFSLLLIIIVVEVASGVWGYMNRDDLVIYTKASVKKTVQKDYDRDENIREMFDTIQSKMQCCGADKASDWARDTARDFGVQSPPSVYSIPMSCCREGVPEKECKAFTEAVSIGAEPNYSIVYDKGCYNLILEELSNHIYVIMSICGAILAVQLLGLILGLILAFSMNISNRYKA